MKHPSKLELGPLPKEEWDFQTISEKELEEAFFYEYKRQLIKEFDKHERTHKNLKWVLCRPGKPWVLLSKEEKTPSLLYSITTSGERPHGSRLNVFKYVESQPDQWEANMSGDPGVDYHFNEEIIKTKKTESIFVYKIDWRQSDEGILAGFKGVLEYARPKQFARFKTQRRFQTNKKGGSLSFKHDAALCWLGVYRRYKHAGNSWPHFFSIYPDEERNKRQIQRACQRAKAIIDALETGKPTESIMLDNYF